MLQVKLQLHLKRGVLIKLLTFLYFFKIAILKNQVLRLL